MSRKRIPLNQNECTADFRIGVPFEQNLQKTIDILLLVEADGYKKLLVTMSAKTDSCENLL